MFDIITKQGYSLLKGDDMNILPVHLLKLRWLLFNTRLLRKDDRDFIQTMQQTLSKVNYQFACPVTLVSLERIYASVKRREYVSN